MPPKRHWLIGKTVSEYEVVARIGEGGMGEVFEGRHPLIGKRVAIKTLLPQFSNDEALTQRFIAEARAVNAIRHRGIVDIFGFGKLDDGTQYFIMEYLEGTGFDRLIHKYAPMPTVEVVEWVDRIVDALGSAHAAGVIHRDIKPSNVFLVDTGQGQPYVKLLDFGIAKTDAIHGQQTPQTRVSMIMGTPDYMAPEQARGEPVGAPTDFYALGCMLHHMLTGQPPYGGPNPMGTMFAHLEQPVMRPSDRRHDLLPALDDLAVWMMQKAPQDRPSSAAEIQRVLDAMWPLLFGGPHPPRRIPRISVASPRASPPPQPKRATRPPVSDTTAPVPPIRAEPVETKAHVARQPVDPLLETAPNPAPDQVVQTAPNPAADLLVDTAPHPAQPPPDQVDTTPRQTAPELSPSQLGLAPPRRWPIFIALALGATFVTAGGMWLVNSRTPPQVEATIVVRTSADEPARPPAPAADAPPVPPVAIDAPVAAAEAPAPPKGTKAAPHPAAALTPQMLSARLNKLDAKLRQREAEAGGELGVMRHLLEDIRSAAASANDDAARKRVWGQMADLQAQLGR